MADSRFYQSLGPRRLSELAAIIGAQDLTSDEADREIRSVSALATAQDGSLTFFDDAKRRDDWSVARPTACVVSEANAELVRAADGVPLIVRRPQPAFALASRKLVQPKPMWDEDEREKHPPTIDRTAKIAPGVILGAGARIGAGCVLEPGVVIGPGVVLADNVRVGANAVVTFADVGAGSQIHAGAQIGDAGFGLAFDDQGPLDAPHFGAVSIGERVTIGCNTTIDRGRFDNTVIGDDSKIDNLVQIAHNVVIGRSCVIAGCCGLAGSAVLGNGVMLGGAVGVADHVCIGDGARLAAAAYLMRDVPPGETWAGGPAKPIQSFFREVAALARLARRPAANNKETA